MEQLSDKLNVDISKVKHSFSKQYPNSSILSMLLDLPDVVSGAELIGAVGVWLSILDAEKQQVFSSLMRNIKEAEK